MRDPTPPPHAPPLPLPIRILTHNIRYATTAPFDHELPWPSRLPRLLAQLKYHTRHHATAIICLQEVLDAQLHDILRGLNGGPDTLPKGEQEHEGEWTYYGVGRDDGARAGEYSPILYRRGAWEQVCSRTVWLSPTPGVAGSKGWDAASVRICGVLGLKGLSSAAAGAGPGGERGGGLLSSLSLLVLNTHLDDQGRRSRVEGAKLILAQIRELKDNTTTMGFDGVVLAGDLNSEVVAAGSAETSRRVGVDGDAAESELESGVASELHSGEGRRPAEDAYTVLNAPGSGMRDLRSLIRHDGHDRDRDRDHRDRCYGHEMTYTGFDGQGDGQGRCSRIDFVHVDVGSDAGEAGISSMTGHPEKNAKAEGKGLKVPWQWQWQVEGYAVLPNVFDDGVYISDHRAVVGDLVLQGGGGG